MAWLIFTGDGLDRHAKIFGCNDIWSRTIHFSNRLVFQDLNIEPDIMRSNFFDLLSQYNLELTQFEANKTYSVKNFYDMLFIRFAKHLAPIPTDFREYSLPQRAGVCYIASVFCFP